MTTSTAENETALLGMTWLDPSLTDRLDLTAADFADPAWGAAWEAIRALHREGHPGLITPADVAREIAARGRVRVDRHRLEQTIGCGGVGPDADHYAASIREESTRRRLEAVLGRGQQMLKSGMAAADVVAEIAPDLTAPAVDAGGPARASTWAPVDLTAILDGTHTTPEPCLMIRNDGVGLLYAGLTHSFHGESESGKSLIAQAEAARVLNAGGRVLFLDFESDPVSVVGRMVEMGADPAALAPAAGRFAYLQPEADFRNGYDLAAFDAVLSEPADLAIVDGVTASLGLFGMSTKDNDDVTAWARLLSDRIARKTGAAVVAIDHVTKDSESRGRFAIGGQAKLSALTGSGYVVEVVEPLGRGLRGVVTVRVAKDRPGFIRARSGPFRAKDRTQEAARFIVDSTGPDTVVTIEAPRGDVTHPETFRPTTLMEKISEHLEVTGTPQSFRSLDKCVSGKADSKRDALALLVAEGFVTVSPGPRNSNMHTLARPYRQADDPQSDRFSGGTHSPGVTVPFSDRDRVPPYRPGHGDTVNDRVPDTVGTQSGHGHTVCRLHPSIPAVAGACVTCDQIAERSSA